MAQEIVNQKNFNVGELDPRVDARADLKVYYAGLELAENLVPLPVGPIVRRPGTVFIDYGRHVLAPVNIDVGFLQTGGAGGTAADALAADGVLFTTTDPLGAADQVLLQFNFGAAVEIHLWDVVDFAAKDPMAAAPAPPPFVYPWPNANFDPDFGGSFLETF
jgi:hypothetical protein